MLVAVRRQKPFNVALSACATSDAEAAGAAAGFGAMADGAGGAAAGIGLEYGAVDTGLADAGAPGPIRELAQVHPPFIASQSTRGAAQREA